MKPFTRKQFIKISAAASAAVFLDACGINSGQKTDNTETLPQDTLTTDTPSINTTPAPTITVDYADKNDARYNILRQGFNKRIDKYPALIAVCTTTEEVAAAVRHAIDNKLPIAVKSGGHSMEGYSCNDDGMVINLSQMNKVELLDDGKIKVGPGCTLSKLYDDILPQGRLLPAGSCATVGVGGLTLGGGYGLFSRKFGLTCDHLLEATMVDGNGNIHTTRDKPELLWALRGGGNGNFGIVTEMTFRTQVAPPTLQANYFKARKLNVEKATSILKTWMELTAGLPETCFSGYVLNGSTLNILITDYGTDNTRLQPILDGLAAVTDTFRSSKRGKLDRMLRNYYGVGEALYFRNSSAGLFRNYDDVSSCITEVLGTVIATPGMIYQMNIIGGKVRDATFEQNAAYPHRAFDFISELQGYWTNPTRAESIANATTHILNTIQEHNITHQYVNYCSAEFRDWQHAYYGNNYERLQAIKRQYDPDNNIRHPQSVKG